MMIRTKKKQKEGKRKMKAEGELCQVTLRKEVRGAQSWRPGREHDQHEMGRQEPGAHAVDAERAQPGSTRRERSQGITDKSRSHRTSGLTIRIWLLCE